MTTLLQDKKSNFHVLAGLMNNPDILSNTQEYGVKVEDFPERYHKIIFGAIYNLHSQGVEEITPVSIDGLLSTLPVQYDVFNSNGGLDYLFKMEELGESENFNYFYNRMKKYSLLRAYDSNGIDIRDIYDVNMVDVKESEKQQEEFDRMSLDDIVSHVEMKTIGIKGDFLFDNENKGSHMAEGLREEIRDITKKPRYGNQLASKYYTAITMGALPKKLMLISGSSGSGKSRFALANILTICIPEIWDSKERKWFKTGATGRGVFISTEQEDMEIKIPSVCFIADVDEGKLRRGQLTKEEYIRVEKAVDILEEAPIWFEELHDFDLQDIEYIIEKNVRENGVTHIAHDYIHTSMKIFSSMAKAGAKNLQEHQILLQMSIKLKELANKYGIWLTTATQLNNKHREDGNLDDSTLAGAKAIAQKVDFGAIMIPVSKKDEEIIDTIMGGKDGSAGRFGKRPTHSISVYKLRGGRWKDIRIWIFFGLQNLRCEDLFVTDYDGNLITEIEPLTIKTDSEEVDEKDIPEPITNETININPHYDTETGEILSSISTPSSTEDSLPDIFNEPPTQEFNF